MAIDEAQSKLLQDHLAIAEAESELGIPIDETLFAIAQVVGDDLGRNANPFVPWSDRYIPFECTCGAIIYADTSHSHD